MNSPLPAATETPADESRKRRHDGWRLLLISTLLPLLVAAVYWPGLGGGFVFDDFPNIVENTALHVTRLAWGEWLAAMFSSPSSDLQRPLAMLSFAINHYFTGLDPWPMKLTNVAIHALNSLLVFALARRVIGAAQKMPAQRAIAKDWIALFASACWALHPINLMAVLFVVQRMEILSHSFVFIGLWLYVSGRQRQQAGRPGWLPIIIGLVPCTMLGLLAKESAVLLPLYAFCLELCLFHFHGKDAKRDGRLILLFAVVLLLPAVAGASWLLPKAMAPGAYASRDYSLAERLLTEPRVVLDYLQWIVLPDLGQLSLYHDDYPPSRGLWAPASTILGLFFIPLVLAIAWITRTRRPLLSLGLFWFLGAQLLTASFLPLELVYEHRNYFASFGICLALTDVLILMPRGESPRRIGALMAILFLLLFTAITHLRAREWSNPTQFSISEAAKHPLSPRATYDLARRLIIMGNYRADSPFTQQAFLALEQARQVPNSGIMPDQAALMLAARTNRPLKPEWWRDMQTRLRRDPIGSQQFTALAGLTNCAIDKKCRYPTEDMMATFGAALEQGPRAELLNIYGAYVLNVLGDPDLALRLWQEASERNRNEPQYLVSMAKLLIAMGRYDEARTQINRLRKLGRLGQNEAKAHLLEKSMPANR